MERIGWENGTLVSKGKVNIGGNIYEVEAEQYEGNTPLSAENLKKMEDNMEEAISGVVESVTNDKGTYIKFMDGTLIQYGRNTGIENGNRVVTYPMPFLASPIVSCNISNFDSQYVHLAQVYSIGLTTCRVATRYCGSATGNTWFIGANDFEWIAIGKWKKVV